MAQIFLFFVLATLFVLLRMGTVDREIDLGRYNQKYDQALAQKKELLAKRASLLSTVNLRKLARKHKLKEPHSKQIIFIE